jgi:hypothetical protein
MMTLLFLVVALLLSGVLHQCPSSAAWAMMMVQHTSKTTTNTLRRQHPPQQPPPQTQFWQPCVRHPSSSALCSATTTTTTTSMGLSPQEETERRETETTVGTLPATPAATQAIARKGGALSMQVEELAVHVGSLGRARLAWDCYRIGIDPTIFHRPSQAQQREQATDSATSRTDHRSDNENDESERAAIRKLLPGSRRNLNLGSGAVHMLETMAGGGGRIEGSVATLVHEQRSRDGTTKLLLELRDGAQVETVLIPWYTDKNRSALCISSQVGCRQGNNVVLYVARAARKKIHSIPLGASAGTKSQLTSRYCLCRSFFRSSQTIVWKQ